MLFIASYFQLSILVVLGISISLWTLSTCSQTLVVVTKLETCVLSQIVDEASILDYHQSKSSFVLIVIAVYLRKNNSDNSSELVKKAHELYFYSKKANIPFRKEEKKNTASSQKNVKRPGFDMSVSTRLNDSV